ncbi:hypothetical protein R1flu_000918 [Riccia fluitans]|uniref:Uncharacterized protein n=1 Tax=Riccia fluitans TaxID=41844 RepID=A0ABD1Y1S4_9MARC
MSIGGRIHVAGERGGGEKGADSITRPSSTLPCTRHSWHYGPYYGAAASWLMIRVRDGLLYPTPSRGYLYGLEKGENRKSPEGDGLLCLLALQAATSEVVGIPRGCHSFFRWLRAHRKGHVSNRM